MADFDLQELAAPLEDLRSKVDAAYKALDIRWKAVESTLKALPIPCDVGTVTWSDPAIDEHCVCLEWRKWRGAKRLCIVEYYDYIGENVDVTPYEEWSGEDRCNLLDSVPKLFARAAQCTKEFIEKATGKGVAE